MLVPNHLGYDSQQSSKKNPPLNRDILDHEIHVGTILQVEVQLEAVHDKVESTVFDAMDTNKDGTITRGEMGAWFERAKAQGMPHDAFEKQDTNGNGLVSWAEFAGPKGETPPTLRPTAPGELPATTPKDEL